MSKMLKDGPELSAGLVYYTNSGGDLSRLKKVMDRLYRNLNADIFVVTDTKGIVLYRANDPEKRGDSHRDIWGMHEALKGENIIATSKGPRGWAIRAIAPVYSGRKIYGVIIIGLRIDDKFAKKIAEETQAQVSFAATNGVLASSLHPRLRAKIDLDKIKQSLLERKPVFVNDHKNERALLYSPMTVVDESFCLIVQTDISELNALLKMQQAKLKYRFLIILLIAFAAGLTLIIYFIINPLKKLKESARATAYEFGGKDLKTEFDGNEIQTTIQAFDAMLETIKGYTSEHNQKEELIAKQKADLSALYDISSAVGLHINLTNLLYQVLNTITKIKLFNLEHKGAIFLVEGDKMNLASHLGLSEEFLSLHKDMKVGECLCGLAAKNEEVIISKNSAKDDRHTIGHAAHSHGHIIIPLISRGVVLGVLCLYYPPDMDMEEHTLELLGTIGSQIGIAIDNARLYEETKLLSLHDPLTGLANRRYLDIILERYFNEAQRFGNSLSVQMLDIDFFKNYNDKHGHIAGDKLLRETARIILKEIRKVDFAARYGGEEFFIMLHKTGPAQAYEVARRIKKAVEEKTEITVSIGISSYNKDLQAKEELIEKADNAMYKAKQKGRNQIESGA